MSVSSMSLIEFLNSELRRQDISARELARRAGIGPTTLQKILDARNERTPDLDTLEKLAKATGQSLSTLVHMVKPDASEIDPRALVIARRIQLLPDDARKLIEGLALNAALNNIDETK